MQQACHTCTYRCTRSFLSHSTHSCTSPLSETVTCVLWVQQSWRWHISGVYVCVWAKTWFGCCYWWLRLWLFSRKVTVLFQSEIKTWSPVYLNYISLLVWRWCFCLFLGFFFFVQRLNLTTLFPHLKTNKQKQHAAICSGLIKHQKKVFTQQNKYSLIQSDSGLKSNRIKFGSAVFSTASPCFENVKDVKESK